jgi:uncharacterized delta-60 repeat protein
MTRPRANRSEARFFEPLEARRMMAAGDLDSTFGVGGKMLSATLGFAPAAIAVQPDGKIVAAGELNNDFAVARVNANGTIDTSFGGGDGLVTSDFGGNRGDGAAAVMIHNDGRIIAAGRRRNWSSVDFGDHGHFAVARYLSDGRPDWSFDSDGKKTFDMPGWGPCGATALTQQPDGKILVAGFADVHHFSGWDYDFAVARLNVATGALDGSFGDGGKVTFGTTTWEEATMIAVAPDGKIAVGGTRGSASSNIDPKLVVARLTAGGSLDQNFNPTGRFIAGGMAGVWPWAIPTPVAPRAMEVAPDGSVLTAVPSGGNFVLARVLNTGYADASFGGGSGRVVTDLGGNDRPNSIRTMPDGKILASGGSSGQFAMVRYLSNGTVDASFGQAGKVITGFGANEAILATHITADGKIKAYGANDRRNIVAAQYVGVLPKVGIYSLDTSASESGDRASLIITRDVRLNAPTRVYVDLGGNASLNADYTSNFVMQRRVIRGIFGEPKALPPLFYIDIPAGQTYVVANITPVDDAALEPLERAQFTLRTDPAYALDTRTSETVSLADNETVRVNFQGASPVVVPGYVADLGLTFADRGGGMAFGWDKDNTAHSRVRKNTASPDFRYDTLNHMHKDLGARVWEMSVPNGLYTVRIVAGDPSNTDSVYRMNLEGQLALAGTPSGDVRWFRSTVNVQVNDGRLTLSNATGSVNNKIAFLEIKAASGSAQPGAFASSLPVRLKTASTAGVWQQRPNGLFSDNQIDEPLWA